jgi:hypothetical protein
VLIFNQHLVPIFNQHLAPIFQSAFGVVSVFTVKGSDFSAGFSCIVLVFAYTGDRSWL